MWQWNFMLLYLFLMVEGVDAAATSAATTLQLNLTN